MVNLRERTGLRQPSVWQGTRFPNVHTVYLTPESETHYRRRLPSSGVATPGGVYLWPNGYVTCYTDEEGDESEGVIYPPAAIERLEFGPTERVSARPDLTR
jgi:hypothetical protein